MKIKTLLSSFDQAKSSIAKGIELPAGLSRIALKAVVDPPVPQIVWYVDGEPFAVSDPDKPVYWPVLPGEHRFQIRLPFRGDTSRAARIVVD